MHNFKRLLCLCSIASFRVLCELNQLGSEHAVCIIYCIFAARRFYTLLGYDTIRYDMRQM